MSAAQTSPLPVLWCDPAQGVVARVARHMAQHGLHPARCVVLVPYGQLIAQALRCWALCGPPGFAPRFESTRNWARSAGAWVAADDDLVFDWALDLLTAQSLLMRAGLGGERHALAGRLVELALQLAPLSAAHAPSQRAGWAQAMRGHLGAGRGTLWFETECALNEIALTWVAHSSYATDVLYGQAVRAQVDALIVLEGLQRDPLTERLAARWAEQGEAALLRLPLAPPAASPVLPEGADVAWHACSDPEDEVERAAACVLQRLAQSQAPVALVAMDRALTRRIGALLAAHGVQMRDETGWKLSTTRAAAQLMLALRAGAHDASSDAVLDWLKNAPQWQGPGLDALEARLRELGLRDWASWCGRCASRAADEAAAASDDSAHGGGWAALAAFTGQIESWRAPMQRPRAHAQWLIDTRELLQAAGQWDWLTRDAAGADVIGALYLDASPEALRSGGRTGERSALSEFSAWVREVLEAGSVRLGTADEAPVTVLPLAQLLGRQFQSVVVPGCDDQHLSAQPDPPGPWSPAQRAALGLPGRDTLAAAQRAAWALALQAGRVDLLWRRADAAGEPVRASPLLQALQLAEQGQGPQAVHPGTDPRQRTEVQPQPMAAPQPLGQDLLPTRLSASAYEDLRHCPYRFFALRELGLSPDEELDQELGKRELGTWLHAVLQRFHLASNTAQASDHRELLAIISVAADEATQALGLSPAEFLPFAAAWPALRDGYLKWWAEHQTQEGVDFESAEPWKEQPLGPLRLVGRLDRIDRSRADGRAFLIDYKTEDRGKTKKRVSDPTEDTQLAFYAALLEDDTLRAAYVVVGEKGTESVEQLHLVEARDGLLQSIQHDMQRIAGGALLPALGEGSVCEHCAARGLCRKDFWSADPGGTGCLDEEAAP